MAECPPKVLELIEKFDTHIDDYRYGKYKELEVRKEFIDPMFAALGWDMANRQGHSERYKEVIHEHSIKTGGNTRAPDYCFRIGGAPKFFLEAKRPSINIEKDIASAFQVRRYAWSAKLPLSILTDFEEFAVYDCRFKPVKNDKPSLGRILYLKYNQYRDRWDDIASVFSKDAVWKGSFDKYVESKKRKKGTQEVDSAFLKDIESWRDILARNIALRNPRIPQRELNYAVQTTIDRIIFLRICEDRGIENYGRLQGSLNGPDIYSRLCKLFYKADERYNSGLFHFKKEKGRDSAPDELTPGLKIDDQHLKSIIKSLYYPGPYEFSMMPPEILGQVYEQFLGKVIRLTKGGQAKVEEKPEVKKAGGVYYTPKYIVDYIVKNTVGKLLEGKTPKQAAKLKILDPACGSGSFLIGAYQFLLDWYLEQYTKSPGKYKKEIYKVPALVMVSLSNHDPVALRQAQGDNRGDWRLTIQERKRINAFDWHTGFPEVFTGKTRGFDAVIGNPPYIRIQALKEWAPLEVEHYKKRFKSASKGNYDIYVVFVENGLSLLNSSGRLGFILPHKFFNAKYGEQLRALVSTGKHLDEVVHFGDQQVFSGATTYTCLMFLDKAGNKQFQVSKVNNLDEWRNSENAIQGKISSRNVSSSEWNFVVGKSAALFEKLKIIPLKLSDISKRIYQGLITGADPVFLLSKISPGVYYSDSLKKQLRLEKDLMRPLCKGSVNIRRYDVTGITKFILFPYELKKGKAHLIDQNTLKTKYPEIWNYLLNNRSTLEMRERGKWKHNKWYAFGRSQNLSEMEQKKILTPSIAKSSSYTLDRKGEYYFVGSGGGGGGGYGVILNENTPLQYEFVLGLLNSRLLDSYLKNISSFFSGGYYAFNRQYIEMLPIPNLNFSNKHEKAQHDKMVKLVDQMLSLNKKLAKVKTPHEKNVIQRQIDATDRQIDNLVYKLYGLTEKEIKIVEEATKV